MNQLSIEVVSAEDLSDEMKEEYEVEYYDCSNYLIVTHGAEVIHVVSDYMEPEDAMFTRDLRWVAELLGKVYELGIDDGHD